MATDNYIPASTPEGRENELISLAYDLVEKRLREGTATSAETVHFLKLGSEKGRAEVDRLKKELSLMEAKTEMLQSSKRMEEMFENAMNMLKKYNGYEDV